MGSSCSQIFKGGRTRNRRSSYEAGGEEVELQPAAAPKRTRAQSTKVVEQNRTPEPVQDLILLQSKDGQPSASLQWKPPANFTNPEDLIHYSVRISSKLTSKVLRDFEVKGITTQVDFNRGEQHDRLEPLREYIFAVHATSSTHIAGDMSMIEGSIDWPCRFPGCKKNRLKITDGVYNFCSREHKVEFDEGYCLYGECSEPAVFSPLETAPSEPRLVREEAHFCKYDHYYRILQTDSNTLPGFLIEVRPDSAEYKDVEDFFRRKWISKERKTAPTVSLVLTVVNPTLEARFAKYKEDHSAEKFKVKKLFYGTDLGCDLHTYQIPCKGAAANPVECSICDLSLRGFDRHMVSMSTAAARVTLDDNPARSHENAEVHEDSRLYGMVMCEVACANTKKVGRSLSDAGQLPEGLDTIKVKGKNPLKGSTEEVIVYKADAVCPRYVLLYVWF